LSLPASQILVVGNISEEKNHLGTAFPGRELSCSQ